MIYGESWTKHKKKKKTQEGERNLQKLRLLWEDYKAEAWMREESHINAIGQIFNIIIENSQTKEKHNHTDTQNTN